MKKRRTSASPSKRAKHSDKIDGDLDSLLKMVDGWRFKLHDKLKKMTDAEQMDYWRASADRARAAGLHVIEPGEPIRPRKKRRSRKTG